MGQFQRPGLVGKGAGAKKGAAVGVKAPLWPGVVATWAGGATAGPYGLVLGLMVLGAGAVLAPVGAGVGAAVGAIAAPSEDDVERAAATLEQALADADLPEALTAWIREAAGEWPVVVGAGPEDFVADTVLEIDSVAVSLASKDPTDWQPGLTLRLSAHGRLVEASDGTELRSWTWEHEGRKARFLEWGKDDGRMFREELARAGRALAAKMIADLF